MIVFGAAVFPRIIYLVLYFFLMKFLFVDMREGRLGGEVILFFFIDWCDAFRIDGPFFVKALLHFLVYSLILISCVISSGKFGGG